MKKIIIKKRIIEVECDCWCDYKTDEYVYQDKYKWESHWLIFRPPPTFWYYSNCPVCWEDNFTYW